MSKQRALLLDTKSVIWQMKRMNQNRKVRYRLTQWCKNKRLATAGQKRARPTIIIFLSVTSPDSGRLLKFIRRQTH